MTNCKCGNPLRKGESECDECLLRRYNLDGCYSWCNHGYLFKEVAQALRMAEDK